MKNGTTSTQQHRIGATKPDSSSPTSSTPSSSSNPSNKISRILRTILLDIPLLIIISTLIFTHCLREIHHRYFIPLITSAARWDSDLLHEFTYYERHCSANDMTTHHFNDLALNPNATSDDVVRNMMYHGLNLFPTLLQPSTISQLRSHIVHRNSNLTEHEAFPVSQGSNRLSFGLDATESPIVTLALREVASHPLLRPTLQTLLGDYDPAVSEITQMTAYHGCISQAWHPDVKPDGNALKYARTYKHSYTLFIPLQDTTVGMGPTEVCPGTHYCTNDLTGTCEKYGMKLSEASEDGIWHAGDGALVNQQLWHRGYEHADPEALERIVFIVSFISRPRLGLDHRQLSRGTYFHMRWNMWGHTFRDLLHADLYMKKPWSVLRCLGLWKAKDRNWGVDLLTASVLRIANSQNGFYPDDLRFFVRDFVVGWVGLPEFLQGRVLPYGNEYGAWQSYFEETIEKCFRFMKSVNGVVLVVYVVIAMMIDFVRRRRGKRSILFRTIRRIVVLYAVLFFAGYLVLRHIERSEWGSNILSKRTLMRPFPDFQPSEPPIAEGLTTLPNREDVLIGSRFDSPYIGAYNHWLDYHTGTVTFRNVINEYSDAYVPNIDTVIGRRMVDSIVEFINTKQGRFLQQDHRNGNWIVLSNKQAQDYTHMALLEDSNAVLSVLKRIIAFRLAEFRFGILRNTRLSRETQVLLSELQRLLFGLDKEKRGQRRSMGLVSSFGRVMEPRASKRLLERMIIHTRPKTSDQNHVMSVGTIVLVNYQQEGEWFKGMVFDVNDDGYDIEYEDGSFDTNVVPSYIVQCHPVVEGSDVEVNLDGQGVWFVGKVRRVMPTGMIDVEYDNGYVEEDVIFDYYCGLKL